MKKAKIEMETLGKLLLLTAFLIIFLLMFKGCKDQMENVGMVGTNEYVCWFSHALKGQISFLLPSACYPIDIEKAQDKPGISVLIRKCWWMHGQGEEDLVTGETNLGVVAKKGISWYDIARTCYIFTPKEDIPIQDFLTYLRNYDKSGKEVAKKEEDERKTTWGYIQNVESAGAAAGAEPGICFDKKTAGDILSKGKMYYIIFYDDRGPFSNGARDKIMISRNPEFGEEQTGFLSWFGNLVKIVVKLGSLDYNEYCYDWKEKAQETGSQEKAKAFFDKLIKVLQRCGQLTGTKTCACEDSLLDTQGELPKDFSIKIKQLNENSYEISLLDRNKKVYEEKDRKFTEKVEGFRLGNDGIRLNEDRLILSPCIPGIIKEHELEHIAYSIVYRPNYPGKNCCPTPSCREPTEKVPEGDYKAIYLTQTKEKLEKC
ncbi:MAG: hypothetical protein Q8O03_06100 [Nanoarchaeota archaeon]|nr:hypothetical protein [Nanoarchaeota archaeon]